MIKFAADPAPASVSFMCPKLISITFYVFCMCISWVDNSVIRSNVLIKFVVLAN